MGKVGALQMENLFLSSNFAAKPFLKPHKDVEPVNRHIFHYKMRMSEVKKVMFTPKLSLCGLN